MFNVIPWILANRKLVAVLGAVVALGLAGLYLRHSGYESCTADRDAADTAKHLQQSLRISAAQDYQATIQAALSASHSKVTQTIGQSNDTSRPAAVISDTVRMLYLDK